MYELYVHTRLKIANKIRLYMNKVLQMSLVCSFVMHNCYTNYLGHGHGYESHSQS